MKELNYELPKEQLVRVEKAIIKKEQHVGSLTIKPNQKLFILKDGVLNQVADEDFEDVEVKQIENQPIRIHRKLKIVKGGFYVIALNKKNALRKIWNFAKQKNIK